MNALPPDILHCVGNASLLALRHIVPPNGARVLLKLEDENPTGGMKDRMVLALICAVKRHPLHIVTSDAFAREKRDRMTIPGAELRR